VEEVVVEIRAQKFMNAHRVKECWECDGILFKHKENADALAKKTGKEILTYTLNAGVRKNEKINSSFKKSYHGS
jgi:hypothetical protein